MIDIPGVVFGIVAFVVGIILGYAYGQSDHAAHRESKFDEAADEAETDRFLADLGVAYREGLAHQIANQCDFIVRTIAANIGQPPTLESLDLKSLIYKVTVDVLSKE